MPAVIEAIPASDNCTEQIRQARQEDPIYLVTSNEILSRRLASQKSYPLYQGFSEAVSLCLENQGLI